MAQWERIACHCRRGEFDPWVRKTPLGEEMATPLQYSCLENAMDRGAWWATQSMESQESDTTE